MDRIYLVSVGSTAFGKQLVVITNAFLGKPWHGVSLTQEYQHGNGDSLLERNVIWVVPGATAQLSSTSSLQQQRL